MIKNSEIVAPSHKARKVEKNFAGNALMLYWVEAESGDAVKLPFPNEDSYEAAQDWYNNTSNSKKKMIKFCRDRNVVLNDPTGENVLLSGWADIAMATYAWQHCDTDMISVIAMLAKEIAND